MKPVLETERLILRPQVESDSIELIAMNMDPQVMQFIGYGAMTLRDSEELTLETLETLGVPVLAYQTDEFPAFFSRSSGHEAPLRAESAEEIAAVMAAKWDLGISGGIAVVNPIPVEDEPAPAVHSFASASVSSRRRATRSPAATPEAIATDVSLRPSRVTRRRSCPIVVSR